MIRARYHARATVKGGVGADHGGVGLSCMGLIVPPLALLTDRERMHTPPRHRLSDHRPPCRLDDVKLPALIQSLGKSFANFAPTGFPDVPSCVLVRRTYSRISGGTGRYTRFVAVKRPPTWSTPIISRRSLRQAAGVWPVAYRKRLQKWAWSENPHCKAISLSEASHVSIIH